MIFSEAVMAETTGKTDVASARFFSLKKGGSTSDKYVMGAVPTMRRYRQDHENPWASHSNTTNAREDAAPP